MSRYYYQASVAVGFQNGTWREVSVVWDTDERLTREQLNDRLGSIASEVTDHPDEVRFTCPMEIVQHTVLNPGPKLQWGQA